MVEKRPSETFKVGSRDTAETGLAIRKEKARNF